MDSPLVAFKGAGTINVNYQNEGSMQEFNTLKSKHSVTGLEEHEVLTAMGIYLRVYVKPSTKKNAIITYHDIGTNHTSFLSFFNLAEMRVICEHFTVYHICAPGHHENATAGSFFDPTQGEQDESLLLWSEKSHPYPTLDQMAQMITSIVGHFGIQTFVGIGMGAGSNILARYALQYPDNVLGLFLINPNCFTQSYLSWMRIRYWELPNLREGTLSDHMLEELFAHWCGFGLAQNEDLVHLYEDLARSLNPRNLAGYIQSYVDRTAIDLVRPYGINLPDSMQEKPNVIRTDVCLVTGDCAQDLVKAMTEMNAVMDPKLTQFISIADCTGMVMEENPDKLAVNFLHFLRNIGLLITTTPEKLLKQAFNLCTGSSELEESDRPITELKLADEARLTLVQL